MRPRKPVKELASARRALGLPVDDDYAELAMIRRGLYAATAPEAERNGYYGPNGWREMRGHPGPAVVSAAARNERDAARLWQVSEQATGVSFAAPVRAAA